MAYPTNGIDVSVGRGVRCIRESRQLSREDVAMQLRISAALIEDYEEGRRRISAVTLFELARLFNVSPSDIFNAAKAILRAH
jgi:transcriptional regulator with XRE-family HTH domain